MKKNYFLSLFLLLTAFSFAQSKYKTQYEIVKFLFYDQYNEDGSVTNDTLFLVKDRTVGFGELSEREQKAILNSLKDIESFSFTEELNINGNKLTVEKTLSLDEYLSSKKFSTTEKFSQNTNVGYVKFDENRLYVNPYIEPNKADFDRDVYYYKLKNRQTVQLDFTEWVVSALTIPLKYRFDPGTNATSEFSVDFNANLFAGYTTGSTTFLHREKVGNKEFKSYFTTGAYFGVSTTTLNATNTSRAKNPLVDTEVTTGLFSIGGGLGGGIDKVSLMVFIGFDFAVGAKSELWNFNAVPYIGLGVGYDLFKFN